MYSHVNDWRTFGATFSNKWIDEIHSFYTAFPTYFRTLRIKHVVHYPEMVMNH